MNEKVDKVYQFNDRLLFSVKDFSGLGVVGGEDFKVTFLCKTHPTVALTPIKARDERSASRYNFKLVCPICGNLNTSTELRFKETLPELEAQAIALYNQPMFEDAKLIRLDDFYIPEIKKFDVLPKDTKYFIKADVKTDKDGDTIIVLYVGHKGSDEKVQYFIKPEKLGLNHDYKNIDPANVLAKIELTLKDRTITQDYRAEK